MPTLDDIKYDDEGTSATLDDINSFEKDVTSQNITYPNPSVLNRAARSAILSEDYANLKSNYQNIASELQSYGRSSTEDRILADKQISKKQAVDNTLFGMLSNPNIDDNTKKGIINSYDKIAEFDAQKALFEQSYLANERAPSEEAKVVRVGMSDMIDDMVQENNIIQKAISDYTTQMQTGTGKTFGELMETIVPFTDMVHIRSISKELFGEDASPNLMSSFWVGSQKEKIRDYLSTLPYDKRTEVTKKLVDIINNNNQILLQSDNDFATYTTLQQLVEGDYTTLDKWADNVTAVLDLIGAGQLTKLGYKNVSRLTSIARGEIVRGGAQPTSVARTVQEVNTAEARDVHNAAILDTSDATAQATYGKDRVEVGADYANELPAEDGSVRSRVHDIGETLTASERTVNEDAVQFFQRGGDTVFTPAEKEAMRADVRASFENLITNNISDTVGLTHRHEMTTVESTPRGLHMATTFGPKDGGFLSPGEALDHVKYNLRSLGVTDEDMTLLMRRGTRYYPLSKEDAKTISEFGAKGDYLVRVGFDYKFNPNDVVKWMDTSTTYNIFDRIPFLNKAGFQRGVLDPASVLDPKVTRPASAAVERTAGLENNLLELGKEFSDKFVKLGDDRKQLVDDYIRYNNKHGLAPDIGKMTADGFTKEEMDAVFKWKEYWDTIYHLENKDLANSLRSKGWQMLEHAGTQTRLVVKPLTRERVDNFVEAYDPTTNSVLQLRKDDLDKLYTDGGGINRLESPADFGTGNLTEFVVTDNKAGGLYPRALRDTDSVLNYREGYYHVDYTAPFFIREKRVNAAGRVYTRAVAVAGSVQEAKHLTARYTTQAKKGVEYFFDENRKGRVHVGDDEFSQLANHSGRSAQRARGKRLEGADTPSSIANGRDHMLSPVDAMIQSAKSISHRVGMRSYLDAAKARYMQQFGHMVKKLPGDYEPRFPSSIDQLHKHNGTQADKDIADARTNWEYINTLEHGFRNSLDDGIKASIKGIADVLGNANLTRAEKAARAAIEGKGLSSKMKGLAFEIYLVLNPLRQMIVQSNQAIVLAANFASYGTGNAVMVARNMGLLAKDTAAMVLLQMAPDRLKEAAIIAGRTEKEMSQMYDDFKYSGLGAGVSRSSLINDSLSALAEEATYNRNKTITKRARLLMQKAGFESGERFNITSAWLAYRDKALRAGAKLDDEVLDGITADARNYTYNMNAAGEMSYNQNSLSTLFQFFQVPHKAATQVLFNRQLTKAERVRLGVFQGVTFGLPATFVYDWLGDSLPDDPDLKEKMVSGLEGIVLNTMLSTVFDQDVKIDYKSLAPVDLLGTYSFVEGLMSADISEMVASSPSGQMLLGTNPRITNLVKTVGRYFGGFFHDYREPTTYSMVANEFLSTFSSGYSNAFKARMAMAYERKMNGFGDITDRNVGSVEAFMMALGFRTVDERNRAYRNDISYQKSKEWKQDVRQYYKDITHHLAMQGVSAKDVEFQARVLNMAWDFFPASNLKEREEIIRLMRADVKGGTNIINDILRIANMDGGVGKARAMLSSLNDEQLNAEARQNLSMFLDEIEAQNKILEQEN